MQFYRIKYIVEMKHSFILFFVLYCLSLSSTLQPKFGLQHASRNSGVEKFLVSLAKSGKI